MWTTSSRMVYKFVSWAICYLQTVLYFCFNPLKARYFCQAKVIGRITHQHNFWSSSWLDIAGISDNWLILLDWSQRDVFLRVQDTAIDWVADVVAPSDSERLLVIYAFWTMCCFRYFTVSPCLTSGLLIFTLHFLCFKQVYVLKVIAAQ